MDKNTAAFKIQETKLFVLQEVDYRTLLRDGVHEIVTEKYHPNNTVTVMYWDTIQQEVSIIPTIHKLCNIRCTSVRVLWLLWTC